MHEAAVTLWLTGIQRLLQCVRAQNPYMELLTRQPTMCRAYMSMTNAKHSQPSQVETQVKSATHRWFGRSTLNGRFTRAGGEGCLGSGIVVRTTLPRTAPINPRRLIRRSTVQQRATSVPSRFICRQTLSAP